MKYDDIYKEGPEGMLNGINITIKKSPTADTRSCDYTKVSKEQLAHSSTYHKLDVRACISFMNYVLSLHASAHDHDKLEDIEGFHKNFATGFEERDWLDRHYQKNRHHLENVDAWPEDVNLFDVLDHIADQTMAGMARSGEIRPVNLPGQLLQLAVGNTVKLIVEHTIVEGEVEDVHTPA